MDHVARVNRPFHDRFDVGARPPDLCIEADRDKDTTGTKDTKD
jgi:hypothetical protein